MPAVNRTSSRHKKPGVYQAPRSGSAQTAAEAKKAKRARMYQHMRARHTGEKVPPPPRDQQQQAQKKHVVEQVDEEEEQEEEEEEAAGQQEDEEEEEDDMEAESDFRAALDGDDDDDGSASVAGGASSSAGSVVHGVDGFSVSLAPFRSSDSMSVSLTAQSSLSDEKILGVALWEWLLPKQEFDCHSLWERFQREWDDITEVERPPGTNRPLNLHAYLTFLRNPTNKHHIRQYVRDTRDTLMREREKQAAENRHDALAQQQAVAVRGSLLHYYLKLKNLMPYETQSQRRKRIAAETRKRKAEEQEQEQEAEEQQQPASSGAAAASKKRPAQQQVQQQSSQQQQQPKAKKQKQQAAPSSPPAGPLSLGQANAFAALLDCD